MVKITHEIGEIEKKERIAMVAQKIKMVNCLLIVVLLTTIIATGCTFTNEKSGQIGSEDGDEIAIVTIEMEGGKDIPDAVIDYAKEFVELQVDYYNNAGKENPTGKGEYSITKAKIVDLTSLNTGTAALTFDVSMWLLEYRLLPDDIAKVPIVGGMQLEEIDGQSWITEWGSTGQPYLVLLYNYVTDIRQRMGVINTDSILHDYGTPEMLERYGNEFTAAAMEMYYKIEEEQPWLGLPLKEGWPTRDMTYDRITFGSDREHIIYRMGREPDSEEILANSLSKLFYHEPPAKYIPLEGGMAVEVPGTDRDVTFFLKGEEGVYRIDVRGGCEMVGRSTGADGTLSGVLNQYGGPNAVEQEGKKHILWYYSHEDSHKRLWFEVENGELTGRMGIGVDFVPEGG